MRTWFSGACFFCYWRRVISGPVPGLSYSLFPGKHNEPRQRQYGRPATGPPLCKGSCRRTPTEGLTASRRTQAVLPVRCPDSQAVLPHPATELRPKPKKPPGWEAFCSVPGAIPPAAQAATPLCTRGAQCLGSHTLFAARHTTGLFCGIGLRLHPSPFRGWLASTGAIWQTAHPHRRQERVQRHAGRIDFIRVE